MRLLKLPSSQFTIALTITSKITVSNIITLRKLALLGLQAKATT